MRNPQISNALLKSERGKFTGFGEDFVVLFALVFEFSAEWKEGESHVTSSAENNGTHKFEIAVENYSRKTKVTRVTTGASL